MCSIFYKMTLTVSFYLQWAPIKKKQKQIDQDKNGSRRKYK